MHGVRILFLLLSICLLCSPVSAATITSERHDNEYLVTGDDVCVSVSRARGTVNRIQSLKPVKMDVLPDTQDGLAMVVRDVKTGKRAVFNQPRWVTAQADRDCVKIISSCFPEDPALASVMRCDAEYRVYQDRFQAMLSVFFLTDAEGPYEISVGQANPKLDFWRRATASSGSDGGACSRPYTIFEGSDRFMICARMDLNGSTHLVPGNEGRDPCALVTLDKPVKEQRYTFDITYKFLSKSNEVDYADVCLWYARNCYSSNKLTKGLVSIPQHCKPRTLSAAAGSTSSVCPLPQETPDTNAAEELAGQVEKWVEKCDRLTLDFKPDDTSRHAAVKMMSDIYKYLEKNRPEKRVVINAQQGSPANLWCHAVVLDGSKINYETIESTKIYHTAMFAHYDPNMERNMLANLALGVAIACDPPNPTDKPDLYALSAKLPPVPLVTETGACLVDGCSRRDVYRSIFANDKACHVLFFNNANEPKKIRATVSAKKLRQYDWNGTLPKNAIQFDPHGSPKPSTDFVVAWSGKDFIVEGTLGPGELVGITSD